MCETPRTYRCRTPRAIKRHKCCECGGAILPGETYENFTGLWDRWGTYKTCSDCLEVRAAYHAAMKRGDDEPPFEHLHEWIREEGDLEVVSRITAICRKRGSLKPAEGELRLYTDAARYVWLQGGKRRWGKGYKCVVTDPAGRVLELQVPGHILTTDAAEAYAHLLAVFYAAEVGAESVVIHTDNMGAVTQAWHEDHPRWPVVAARDRIIARHGLAVSYVFVAGDENPADAASRKPGMR